VGGVVAEEDVLRGPYGVLAESEQVAECQGEVVAGLFPLTPDARVNVIEVFSTYAKLRHG
jgi:hypothetical protein